MTPNSFNAAAAYQRVGVQTRVAEHDQYQLVVMMYEAILENLTRARGAIEQGNVLAKVEHITKSMRILQEGLRTSLDLEKGGELAANLANLYEYCAMRMTQANASNDLVALEEVSSLLRSVADAWKQMRPTAQPVAQADTQTQAAPAAPATKPTGMTRQFAQAYGSPSHAPVRTAALMGA